MWRYVDGVSVDYDASFEAVSRTLLDVFAEHFSVSVQASIWIIGRAIVERHPEVAEITMTLPNLHHWTADIERFGIDERPPGLRLDDRAARADPGDGPAVLSRRNVVGWF